MTIGLIFENPGITRAQYDEIRHALHPDNSLSPGMLFHAAGAGENGWRVIEVWESQEAAERYFQETLRPALQQANVPTTIRPQAYSVHNILQR